MYFRIFFIFFVSIFALSQANCSVKPGACPPLKAGTVGICVEKCSNDYSCPDSQKCCSNGCGRECKYPIIN